MRQKWCDCVVDLCPERTGVHALVAIASSQLFIINSLEVIANQGQVHHGRIETDRILGRVEADVAAQKALHVLAVGTMVHKARDQARSEVWDSVAR